jgi:hypothetical protein
MEAVSSTRMRVSLKRFSIDKRRSEEPAAAPPEGLDGAGEKSDFEIEETLDNVCLVRAETCGAVGVPYVSGSHFDMR